MDAEPGSVSLLVEDAAVATEAFERFFEDTHVRLFRALYLVTGRTGDAEDLVQESFVKVWERWDRVRSMERPEGYLFRVAMNSARSRARRRSVAARLIPGRSEFDRFEEVDQRDAVVRALRAVPPRQRAAVVLTELLGYDATAAASILRVKPATVRSLASLARSALRDAMRDGDD
jgi:RNA polymerase sigma factor (sigma-70 family)